jgi:hypothetical protein
MLFHSRIHIWWKLSGTIMNLIFAFLFLFFMHFIFKFLKKAHLSNILLMRLIISIIFLIKLFLFEIILSFCWCSFFLWNHVRIQFIYDLLTWIIIISISLSIRVWALTSTIRFFILIIFILKECLAILIFIKSHIVLSYTIFISERFIVKR